VQAGYSSFGVLLTLPMISSHEHVSGEVKRSVEHELAEKGILAKRRARGGWSGGEVWLVPTQRTSQTGSLLHVEV
jgi:hypothetical protein